MADVLIIDDEQRQRDILRTILAGEGFVTDTASSAEEGLSKIRERPADDPCVVITDLKMQGMSGLDLLEKISDIFSENLLKPAVIIMTAYGTIPSAVDAMRKGAFNYLVKPLERDVVVHNVREAAEKTDLRKENIELKRRFNFDGIIGTSRKMKGTIEVLKKASPTGVTVLIQGESGTGKELIARAIHYSSDRKAERFTAINCAAIPDTLIESELFGHEAGAFTGATHRKIGLFELTNKGTLFLDEIGDLPLLMQTKILRVLQDKEVRKVGGKESTKVDVRIVAATNKNLETETAKGQFREDLYYRIRVVAVDLPPLRERKEDIPRLAQLFIDRYNREFGKDVSGLTDGALRGLTDYYWPGNIRQFESVIERAVLMCEGRMIDLNDIKEELRVRTEKSLLDIEIPDEGINFEEFEKNLINQAMKKANNVASDAARLLGMTYKTFWYRLNQKKWTPQGSSKDE